LIVWPPVLARSGITRHIRMPFGAGESARVMPPPPQDTPDSGRQALQLGAVFDFVRQCLGRDSWILGLHFADLLGQLNVRVATAAISCLREPFARSMALRARQHRGYRAMGLVVDA
jgi:hypothetical protein